MSFSKPKELDQANTSSSVISISSASRTDPKAVIGTILGKNSSVKGEILFEASADIHGKIEGSIIAKDTIKIGETALINAGIEGTEVIVYGTVQGDIRASTRLSLRKPAKVMGNIFCPTMSIEEGVIFEGTCTMKQGRK